MSARSYLSIGDVLTLLRQEFPDVTISKIRFLESQGLVNPERTPSGYRKFYEHDVERLRWVLRQQREHFLPLRIIKDRLDDEPIEPTGQEHTPASGPGLVRVPDVQEPVLVGRRVSASVGALDSGHPDTSIVDDVDVPEGGPMLPGIMDRSAPTPTAESNTAESNGVSKARAAHRSSASGGGEGTPVPSPPGSAPRPSSLSHSGSSGEQRNAPPPPPSPRASGSRPSGSRASGSQSRGGADPGAAKKVEPARPSGSSLSTHPPTPTSAPSDAAEPTDDEGSDGTGTSLSLDELAAAVGLHADVIRDLEGYGLLRPTTIAGLASFDGEALAVATLAARFAQFGIEPRHLRLYKNAADREAGFVEQVVLPLVRQRNPEARARAATTADELARLGQELRASLLRSALGDLLKG